MSDDRRDPVSEGARTSGAGTPVPVDMTATPHARGTIALFVAAPIIWSVHFMVVYVVTEAGCTGDGPGLAAFDPPVPTVVTHVSTAVAALACVAVAVACVRRWRADGERLQSDTGAGAPLRPPDAPRLEPLDRGGALPFVGFLLALLGVVEVLFVGLPALWLPAC